MDSGPTLGPSVRIYEEENGVSQVGKSRFYHSSLAKSWWLRFRLKRASDLPLFRVTHRQPSRWTIPLSAALPFGLPRCGRPHPLRFPAESTKSAACRSNRGR